MPNPIRFVFAVHDHQPIGNFEGVFEQAYQDGYRALLDLFEQYPWMRIALHTSGPLAEWLDAHHPEYLDRLAQHVASGRIEIIGGAFYEPILSMIPERDGIGQICSYTEWLRNRLGAEVRGMWMPERVWEPGMARLLARAGIEYTILDDFHFKNAGLDADQLHGYFVTEDDGHLLRVFPGSERLRYVIPFGDPQSTIDYLRDLAARHPGTVATVADDGEKFGVWPETKLNVFDRGWLRRWLDLVAANLDWIQMTTPSEVLDQSAPQGKIYLPEGSYREMTEWVLPPEQLADLEKVRGEMQTDPRWPQVARFVRGGFWRNFKVRYPETGEMYARMMSVSGRLQKLLDAGIDDAAVGQARFELYRGQCNCPYWHGAFGGVYLPHLRNAVYQHLIAADNLLDRAAGRPRTWVEAASDDLDFDGRPEVQLANDKLVALVAPSRGGQMYELDIRSIGHNLLATLARRPEAYHARVLAGPSGAGGSVVDANSPAKFKQEGLQQRLQYDAYLRKSLIDHWHDENVSLAAVAHGDALERGDFVSLPYECRLRRNPGRCQALLSRQGNAWGVPLKITKGITLESGSSVLEIAYLIEGLPPDRWLHFSVELNFAGMPAGADDRFFHADAANPNRRLGQLGARLDLADIDQIGLIDQWLGLDVGLTFSRPTGLWTYPIETVSQSEGGFELVHQSVVVQPHWHVQGDPSGRWSVTIQLALDTTLAESRRERTAETVRLGREALYHLRRDLFGGSAMTSERWPPPIAREVYEALADDYARQIETKPHNAYYERPATLSLLPDVAGRRVLDAGCGPGVYAEWLANHGASVVGVDVSPRMIEHARRRLAERAEFHVADLGRPLEFLPHDSFDIVIAPLCLDYIRDLRATLGEFGRVMRVGGELIFSMEHPCSHWRTDTAGNYFAVEEFSFAWKGFGVEMPSYRRPLAEILNSISDAGFRLDRVLEPTPSEDFRRTLPAEYEKLLKFPLFICFRAVRDLARPMRGA